MTTLAEIFNKDEVKYPSDMDEMLGIFAEMAENDLTNEELDEYISNADILMEVL